jgi:hypothetical protein
MMWLVLTVALYENASDLTLIVNSIPCLSGVSPGTMVDDSAPVLYFPRTHRRLVELVLDASARVICCRILLASRLRAGCFCCCSLVQIDQVLA